MAGFDPDELVRNLESTGKAFEVATDALVKTVPTTSAGAVALLVYSLKFAQEADDLVIDWFLDTMGTAVAFLQREHGTGTQA
jgi:hypothetical protein